jgi:RNA polymerase sigma-70 factor (ECF subfamily)
MDMEATLVDEARRGSTKAFSDLIRIHQAQVRAYLARYVRRREAIDDLAQETFFAAFRAFSSFRGASSVRLWFLGIARNQALMFLRQERTHRADRLDSLASNLEEWLAQDLERATVDPGLHERQMEALRGCLRKLPESSSSLVRGHYFARKSASDLARESGRSPGAVWIALMRIREALAQCVEQKLAVVGGNP